MLQRQIVQELHAPENCVQPGIEQIERLMSPHRFTIVYPKRRAGIPLPPFP